MKQKTYLRWGVTITAAACAILVFYDTFFQDGVLFIFIEKLFGILKPVLYGLAMAYLLTPIVDFFDRLLRDRLGVKRAGLMRCLSILVTWLLALGLVYLLFSILIPELVASVSLLFSNLESYYRTIYTWVTQLVEDNPYISERVLTLVRDYYNELVDCLLAASHLSSAQQFQFKLIWFCHISQPVEEMFLHELRDIGTDKNTGIRVAHHRVAQPNSVGIGRFDFSC